MYSKIDISCDPTLWSKLSKSDQFRLMLKAKADPVFFWEHPKLGNMVLWPSQKELLREFNLRTPEGIRKYKELLFSAGMRSGKTAIAALILLTELYLCLFMDSPQKHYDLLPKEEITFLATASTEKQCHRTIFSKVVAFIETSPFFCSFDNEIQFSTGILKFPKNLVVRGLGSNLKSNVGLTVKVFVAEEINFTGEESYKVSPKDLYNRLSKSTTTFKPFNEDIKVAISSRADGNDFLSKRIELTKLQKLETTLILQKTTLELNPNLTEKDLEDEKLMDEDSWLNDYGEGVSRGGGSYFKTITIDSYRKWNLRNIFYGEPESGSNKPFTPDLRLDWLKYDPNAIAYGLVSDPASVGDGFGLGLAHLTMYDQIIFDGLTVFKPQKYQELDPKMIGLMVDKIIQKVPVEFYAFDIYMYNELRDKVNDLGIETIQHQLRLPDWEALKERFDTNRINGPFSKYVEKEMSDLMIIRGKVDHPNGGSKDAMDAMCQAVAVWDNPKFADRQLAENQILTVKGLR